MFSRFGMNQALALFLGVYYTDMSRPVFEGLSKYGLTTELTKSYEPHRSHGITWKP